MQMDVVLKMSSTADSCLMMGVKSNCILTGHLTSTLYSFLFNNSSVNVSILSMVGCTTTTHNIRWGGCSITTYEEG